MSMPLRLSIILEAELFPLEECEQARTRAAVTGGAVYSWKTTCRANWLEKGISVVDVLGLVVLPASLPGTIEMPDDPPDTA